MKSVKSIILFLMSFWLNTLLLFSQTFPPIDCPEQAGNWNNSGVNFNFNHYGPGGEVDFEYRNAGGNEIHVRVSWGTFQNNSDFVPDETMKKILEYEAVRQSVPSTPGGEYFVNVYFIRECFAKVKLVLELDRTLQNPCCDEGASLPNSIKMMIENEYHDFIYFYNEVTCGYKCCARRYRCVRYWDNIKNMWLTQVDNPTTISITNCAGNSMYRDCLPPYDFIPCQDVDCTGYY